MSKALERFSDPFVIVSEPDAEIEKSLTQWFKEKWVDISRPKKGGGFEPCGRADADSGKYPKCVPESKASSMTAEEIRSAVRRKRKAESTQDREGKKPINVPTMLSKESVNVPTNPELYARVKSEAKQKFDVYPSAYANAWLVREYKSRGGKYRIEKAETPAWQREEGKNPKGGLNAAGRASYNRETGGNLKPPVRSGDNPRRASFLARMGNNAGPERDENGEPTRLLLSLQAWGADSKADARAKAKAISARNANKVDKGDFTGHPFRGNQWADSSGASTIGASEASEVNSERNIRLRTTADNINDKLEVLREAGATIKVNRNGLDYADREAYTSQLPMVSLAEPNAQLIANGAAMTEEALDDDGTIVVIEDKDGRIAGAMSMGIDLYKAVHLAPRLRDTVAPNTMWLEMRSAGSTMSVDGVGSALLAAAIVDASERDAGLFLVPLNGNAQKFWEAKGFVTVQQEKILGRTETTYQYLDAESVRAIANDLDGEFE